MKPYTRLAACERCSTRLTVTATRGNSNRAVTSFSVACPSCKRPVALQASCDLDESTIQVAAFERPA
jgi:hypothetical protein